ncbi:MAG: AAA family ATPase [Nitrososphaerota archaeon]
MNYYMETLADLYLIAGVPGVGKTMIGSLVAKMMRTRFIDLPDFVKSERLYTAYDKSSKSYIVDVRTLSAALGSVIEEEIRPPIVATHIAFKPRGCRVLKVVVLRKNPLRLLATLRSRGYPAQKVAANVAAELMDEQYVEFTHKFDGSRVAQLDVTHLGRYEAAKKAVKLLSSESSGDTVDWVSLLERGSKLNKLLLFLSKYS